MDSFLFGRLAVIFILLPAGQSYHIAQVLIFFILALVLVALKLLDGKMKSGLCYYLQLCIRLPSENNNKIISQEQGPLLDKPRPSVLYTDTDIKGYGKNKKHNTVGVKVTAFVFSIPHTSTQVQYICRSSYYSNATTLSSHTCQHRLW